MRKTIFTKMMLSTLILLLVMFLLLGGIMFSVVSTYATNEKADFLTATAQNMADYTIVWNEKYQQHSTTKATYNATVESIASITDTEIIVVNTDSRIFASSTYAASLAGRVPMAYMDEALNGNTEKLVGTMDGIFPNKVLTIAHPIKYQTYVIGVVFVNSSVPSLQSNKMELFRMFFISCAFVFILAIILMYILSQKMTKSIKDIRNAARALAAGHYETRAKIKGNDEIAELGRTFNYMAASLQKLDDTQTAFIANVSHELRTPMTTIAGFTENILNGTIPPEQQDKYLQIVLDESRRLSRMVTDMLDISKLSLGQYNISKSEFNIAEMLRLILIQYEAPIEEKHLDVSVDIQQDTISVIADKDAITRVITNLIDNAIKFSDPGGRLHLSIITRDNKAYVAVSNEGIGIDPQDINRVFDRFYKTDKSRNDKKGTGLGLHLAQNLLNLQGETIAVKSEDLSDADFDGNPNHPARRTTFVFSLSLGR